MAHRLRNIFKGCAVSSRIRVNELFEGHKYNSSTFSNIDWHKMEQILDEFSQSTFNSLNAKFHVEVCQEDKIYSFLSEVRFARVVKSIDPGVRFIIPKSTPTPDIRATISGQQVDFEVSRLVEHSFSSATPMDKIVNSFKLKVSNELKQLTLPVSAVVVAPERNWSVESTYRWILPDVKAALGTFSQVPCVIIHLQYVPVNPLGWILLNSKATSPMPTSVANSLVSLGFVKV